MGEPAVITSPWAVAAVAVGLIVLFVVVQFFGFDDEDEHPTPKPPDHH